MRSENTELNSVRILINYIADIYLRDCNEIIEIGSGTCHHIMELSKKLKHNPTFYALDWSESTTLIAERLKKKIILDLYIHSNLISLIQSGIKQLNYLKRINQ